MDATKRVRAATFGDKPADARSLVLKLTEIATARNKENVC
jgi:hypothetical protein